MLAGVLDSFYEQGLPDPSELELEPSLAKNTLEVKYPLKVAHFESTKSHWADMRNDSLRFREILQRERAYLRKNLGD